jgi:hypothetical protein
MGIFRSASVALVVCGFAALGLGVLAGGAGLGAAPSGATVGASPAAAPLYQVSITEAGLPVGLAWSVTLTNSSLVSVSNSSTTIEINFTVPNGSYSYAIANVTNSTTLFVPSPQNGSFAVSGQAIALELYFVGSALPPPPTSYTLTFTETGLPGGTPWSVKLVNASGGTSWNNSTASSVSFPVTNGAYSFTITSVGMCRTAYVAHPSSGTVTIDGANQTIAVTFTSSPSGRELYTITFNESGLPNGTAWQVRLCGLRGGCETRSSTNTTIVFEVPNGTYSFFVPTVGGKASCRGWGSDGFWGAYGGCGGFGGLRDRGDGGGYGGYGGLGGGGDHHHGGQGSSETQYTPNPASGNVTVAGANVTVSIVFTATTTSQGGCGGGGYSSSAARW